MKHKETAEEATRQAEEATRQAEEATRRANLEANERREVQRKLEALQKCMDDLKGDLVGQSRRRTKQARAVQSRPFLVCISLYSSHFFANRLYPGQPSSHKHSLSS